MKYDQLALQQAQRYAFETLAAGITNADNSVIKPAPVNITMGAMLIQELAYTNSGSPYLFQFGNQAPVGTSTLNNVVLGNNNAMIVYGIQILIGIGANANNRIYQSTGVTQNDNSIYNGQLQLSLESNQPIQKMDMQQFYEEGPNNTFMGFQFINPMRNVTGKLSRFEVAIVLPNSISALTLTSNLFISVRLHGALGLA
jgi:hypothetical protein